MTALTAILFLTVGCSSTDKWNAYKGPVHTYAEETGSVGFQSEVISDTVTNTAKVLSIDPGRRTMELKPSFGGIAIFTAGPQVPIFDQLKVGDQVKIVQTEEMAVSIVPAGKPLTQSANVVVVKARSGQPATVTTTRDVTASVVSVNPTMGRVTVRLENGPVRRVQVVEGINVADFKPGDEVSVRLTDSRVISVEKPAKP